MMKVCVDRDAGMVFSASLTNTNIKHGVISQTPGHWNMDKSDNFMCLCKQISILNAQ